MTTSEKAAAGASQAGWRQALGVCSRYWFRDRWRILFAPLLIALAAAAELLAPLALGGVIGAVGEASRDGGQAAMRWLLLAGGALLLHAVFKTGFDAYWNRIGVQSILGLQRDAFSRVQRFSSAWHSDTFAGATVHRLSRARWAIDMIGVVVFARLGPPVLMVLAIGAMLSHRLPAAGLIFFAATALYLGFSIWLSAKWVRPANIVAARMESALTGAIADAISNNAAVKAFGAETREDRRLDDIAREWSTRALVSYDRASLMQFVQLALWAVLQTSVLAALALSARTGATSAADLGFAAAAILQLGAHLRSLGGDIRVLQRAFGEFGEISDFLSAPFDVDDPPQPKALPAPAGDIVFDNVVYGYGARPPLFSGLSLHIAPGERVALVGATGSGKSTFVKLVQRLYDVTSGEIRIDGVDVRSVNQADLRRRVASVPQEPALFHRSLAENIGYARPEAGMDEIIAAAKRARAHDFIMASANGYDTMVGERGLKLSGGERQRVAIARAFLADAPIVVFDEATASLDTLTERLIQQAMDELMVGRTTIIVAHRLSTIRRADRILVFEGGRLVEEGAHEALMAMPGGRYRRLVGVDSDILREDAA